EPCNTVVDVLQILVRDIGGDFDSFQISPAELAATLQSSLVACPVQQNSTHRFRSGPKEMSPPIPVTGPGRIDQSEVRLMHQGGGLQGAFRRLLSHSRSGEFPQF